MHRNFRDQKLSDKHNIIKKAMIDHIFVSTTSVRGGDTITEPMIPYLSYIIDRVVDKKLKNFSYSFFHNIKLTKDQFLKLDSRYPSEHYIRKPKCAKTLMTLENITFDQFFQSDKIMICPFDITTVSAVTISNDSEYVYETENDEKDGETLSLKNYITRLVEEEKKDICFVDEQIRKFIQNFGYDVNNINFDKIKTLDNLAGCCVNGSIFNTLSKKFNLKLVKLTNEFENHNYFQFTDGLNVDKNKFTPYGTSQSGGIYFINASDIYDWLQYGEKKMYHVRAVKIPDDAKVYIEYGKFKADKIFLEPRKSIKEILTSALVASLQ